MRWRVAGLLLIGFLVVGLASAQEAFPLLAVHGTVEKAGKGALTVRPRQADGRFSKSVALKLVGTSKIFVLVPQKRGGKTVLTQREADATDLHVNQAVALIYTTGKDGAILLSAVVTAAGK